MKYDLIYFIGDSFTWAAGFAEDINKEVTLETRWTKQVADHFKLAEVNKARGGTSVKYAYHQLIEDIELYKQQGKTPLVVVFYSMFVRMIESWTETCGLRVLSMNEPYDTKFKETFISEFTNLRYLYQGQISMILAIQNYLKANRIDFVDSTWDNLRDDWDYIQRINLHEYPRFNYSVLDTKQMIWPSIAEYTRDYHFTNKEGILGHWNLQGNDVVAKLVIDKILELYPNNFK